MLELRDYQRASLDALYEYWANDGGNGLIVLPTGAGKALVIAKLIEELLRDYPSLRIVNVTHSKTLVAQNYKEFLGLCPFAPAGIYSAGLGRRDANAQVLFAGIQSVATKTEELGEIDLVIIDEAHAISRDANTLYGKFFNGVIERNESSRRVGLTATDYRMDSGRLTDGDDRLFDDVVYEIGIGELIAQGHLSPLTSKSMHTQIDTSGLHKRGGEFIAGELERAADQDPITEGAVREAISYGADRRAWLFFCSGQDHSDHVRDELRRQGISAESVTSRTKGQDKIIRGFAAGEFQALCSANMLTTGFNVPHVDLISMLRPTASTGLYVQICGRGTRNAKGKKNCLILDHSGNVRRHGPVDMVQPKTPGKGDGEIPLKECPQCHSLIMISKMTCDDCGHEFPPNEEEKITARADDAPILSTEKPWSAVMSQRFAEHPAKVDGKPNTVKITYMVGFKAINEWACPGHSGYPKSKADRYWLAHNGNRPFPKSAVEWLERAGELKRTAEIQLDYAKNPKYPEIIGHRVADNDNEIEVDAPKASNDNSRWMDELDDAIPF